MFQIHHTINPTNSLFLQIQDVFSVVNIYILSCVLWGLFGIQKSLFPNLDRILCTSGQIALTSHRMITKMSENSAVVFESSERVEWYYKDSILISSSSCKYIFFPFWRSSRKAWPRRPPPLWAPYKNPLSALSGECLAKNCDTSEKGDRLCCRQC